MSSWLMCSLYFILSYIDRWNMIWFWVYSDCSYGHRKLMFPKLQNTHTVSILCSIFFFSILSLWTYNLQPVQVILPMCDLIEEWVRIIPMKCSHNFLLSIQGYDIQEISGLWQFNYYITCFHNHLRIGDFILKWYLLRCTS